jgi:hypothetical protein
MVINAIFMIHRSTIDFAVTHNTRHSYHDVVGYDPSIEEGP